MLITCERVWAVSLFSTWEAVFSSCHNNHELEQSPTGGVLEPVRGTPIRNEPKRGSAHAPLLITLVHPLYTYGKTKLSRWLADVQGARQTLQILIWSRFDGQYGRRRRQKAVPSFLSMFFGDVPPFVKLSLLYMDMASPMTVLLPMRPVPLLCMRIEPQSNGAALLRVTVPSRPQALRQVHPRFH